MEDRNVPPIMIKNKEYLEQIIVQYGKYVFSEMVTPSDLLRFVVDNLILSDKDIYVSEVIDDTVNKFIEVLNKTVKIDDLNELNRGKLIVRGTFGNLYEGPTEDTCYKSCRSDSHYQRRVKVMPINVNNVNSNILDDPEEIFKNTKKDYDSGRNSALFEMMHEISNYIIWKSLILYINDRLILLTAEEKNDYPDIDKYMTSMKSIYYLEEALDLDCDNTDLISFHKQFRIGYKSDRNSGDVSTFLNLLNSRIEYYTGELEYEWNKTDLDKIKIDMCREKINSKKLMICNILLETFNMFDDFRRYDRFGISLVHRDSSSKNIMIYDILEGDDTQINMKFIDYAALQTRIKFGDGSEINIGHYFDETYNNYKFMEYDYVLFSLFVTLFSKSILKKIDVYKGFKKTLKLNSFQYMIDPKNSISVWEYPYMIDFSSDIGSKLRNIVQNCIRNIN